MVNAVVLAGTDKNRKRLVNGMNKCFLRINNRFVADYVVDALMDSKTIDNIALVGPASEIDEMAARPNNKILLLNEKGNLLENALYGHEELKKTGNADGERYTFFATGDIPLLTKHPVNDFIVNCKLNPANKGNDLYFPIIKKEETGEYGKLQRNYFKMDRKEYRISNFLLADAEKIKNNRWINKCFDSRKMASFYSKLNVLLNFPDLLWKYYVSRNLSKKDIEKTASEALEAKVMLVETTFSESFMDIDTSRDFEYIKSIMLSEVYKRDEKSVVKSFYGFEDSLYEERKEYYDKAVNGLNQRPFENLGKSFKR